MVTACVAAGAAGGFGLGRYTAPDDLAAIMAMPPGLYLDVPHHAVWQRAKSDPVVSWLVIPKPDQARVVSLFSSPPSPPTTTTTLPKETKR